MTRDWQDISAPLDASLPRWPGSPGVRTRLRLSMARGDIADVTELSMDVHSGTHVDAPCHFIDQGATVDDLGLEPFIGPAIVLDTGSTKEIGASMLDAAMIPHGTERLLLRTANSLRSDAYRAPFEQDYAGVTLDGAQWLATRQLSLVGIDYLSIQRYSGPADVHRTLLDAGIAILEGLSLAGVTPGAYQLVCLPMRLMKSEGAPARAILLPLA